MAQIWYCLIDGKQVGPFGSGQLRELASTGQLRPVHFVRLSTSNQWTIASQVKGLFTPVNSATNGNRCEEPQVARWVVRVGDREHGPYTDYQLRRYATEGSVLPDHDIRLVNTPKWTKASKVKNLFAPYTSGDATPRTTEEFVHFACGSCGQKLHCMPILSGKQLSCPSCKQPLTVPNASNPQVFGEQEKASPKAPPAACGLTQVAEEPVTVQKSSGPSMTGEKIGGFRFREFFKGLKFTVASATDTASRPSKGTITFYGKGTVVDLGLGPIHDPLVYAAGHRFPAVQEASLIELPLPVKSGVIADRLPYWPTYHECSPQQRRRYLEWLYSGRSDPSVELGYVFIFFYGLEHRVLVDGQDHEIVIDELVRLLSIYTNSRSFINYASALLWLTVYLAADRGLLSDRKLAAVVRATTRWNESIFRYCFGYFCRQNVPLPFDVAFAIAEHDERSKNSIVTRRHSDKFRDLFAARYGRAFPDGFIATRGIRERKIDYHPGSATLLAALNGNRSLTCYTIPDVSSRRQFLPLVKIWNDCIDELRDYDRASKRVDKAASTAETYEALPVELRTGDHPELEAWQRMIDEFTDEGGWPIMPVSKLAQIKQIPCRAKLTKKQCERLLTTADLIGVAIEPDARITNRVYQWDEAVVVFQEEGVRPTELELKAYKSAAIVLALGIMVARADGSLDEYELERISDHIEQNFNLTDHLSKRLEAFRHLLVVRRPSELSVAFSLKKSVPVKQRSLIGKYLVGVAAADTVICEKERKALAKIFRTLGLTAGELEVVLKSYELYESTPQVRDSLKPPALNIERIRAIHEETARVQSLLHDVLSDALEAQSDESDVKIQQSTIVSTLESENTSISAVGNGSASADPSAEMPAMGQLAEQYHSFCKSILAQQRWNRNEIADLARKEGLMLNAALEVLNEWSTDVFGDWLIEDEGAQLTVRQHLVESL